MSDSFEYYGQKDKADNRQGQGQRRCRTGATLFSKSCLSLIFAVAEIPCRLFYPTYPVF